MHIAIRRAEHAEMERIYFMNILVVEDDAQTAGTISKNIMDCDHMVETVGTGRAALKRVREKRFELMLLDIHLPDCMGLQLISQFKERWPDMG